MKIFTFLLALLCCFSVMADNYRLKSYTCVSAHNAGGLIDKSTYFWEYTYDSVGRLCGESVTIMEDEDNTTIDLALDYSDYDNGTVSVTQSIFGMPIATYSLPLDESGKVTGAEFVGGFEGPAAIGFTYENNRLSGIFETDEEETYITELSYEEGNLVKASVYSDVNPDHIVHSTYSYGDIPNTYRLALIESLYEIDMWGMDFLMQAGLMGEPSAQLPTASNIEMQTAYTYSYELDANGCPVVIEMKGGTSFKNVFTLEWEAYESGISSATLETDKRKEEIFTLDGRKVSDMSTGGIYIVRKSDGSTVKVAK